MSEGEGCILEREQHMLRAPCSSRLRLPPAVHAPYSSQSRPWKHQNLLVAPGVIHIKSQSHYYVLLDPLKSNLILVASHLATWHSLHFSCSGSFAFPGAAPLLPPGPCTPPPCCPEHSPWKSLHGQLPRILQPSTPLSPQWGLLWPLYLKLLSAPTFQVDRPSLLYLTFIVYFLFNVWLPAARYQLREGRNVCCVLFTVASPGLKQCLAHRRHL